MKVGLIGTGFVGGSLKRSFEVKGQKVVSYDKFKQEGSFLDILNSDIIFFCLPTPYIKEMGFCKNAIYKRYIAQYTGIIRHYL